MAGDPTYREIEPDVSISFWKVKDVCGVSHLNLTDLESTIEADSTITPADRGRAKAVCQLGLMGAVLPPTLNSTISYCMSNLNFQLVLARQHAETLQQCAQNWQNMARTVNALSLELKAIVAEGALHNFHLPTPISNPINNR